MTALQDNINEALDYEKVLAHILNFVKNHHFQLIETLAENLAQEILRTFSTNWVQITLHILLQSFLCYH